MAKLSYKICAPAWFYFIVSSIALLLVIFQNIGNSNMLSVGSFNSRVPHTGLIIIFKILAILFWTWIIDLICKAGYKWVSWIIVLFPFILIFLVMWTISLNH
jgi:hypothetical protein